MCRRDWIVREALAHHSRSPKCVSNVSLAVLTISNEQVLLWELNAFILSESVCVEEKKLVLRTNSHSEGLINQCTLGLFVGHHLRYSVRTDASCDAAIYLTICAATYQVQSVNCARH
jgi:hypothetical protein